MAHCSNDHEFSLFPNNLTTRSLQGLPPAKEDILRLLELAPDAPEVELLRRQADSLARKLTNNQGLVWSAIGVDQCPCTMNCRFCSFGEKWGLVKAHTEWSEEDIVRTASLSVRGGASWITLRTTEFYSTERLAAMARKIRAEVPGDYSLAVNTGELDAAKAELLCKAGVTGVYHTLRLGEGRDTSFDPAERLATMASIRDSPLKLYYLVEPLGVEHTNEEIADHILVAHRFHAALSGVMGRVNVPGTPFEGCKPVGEARISQIIAICRLCGGTSIRDICVVPPSVRALQSGANVVTIEIGAIPRSDSIEYTTAWNDFGLTQAGELLRMAGYQIRIPEAATHE